MHVLIPLIGSARWLRWLLRLAIWHAIVRYTGLPGWSLIVIVVVLIVVGRIGRSALRNRH